MKLVTAMAMLLMVALAGIGWAATPTGGSIRDGDVIGQIFEDRYDFIEGWNVDQSFDGSWTYGAPCQGPAATSRATRISPSTASRTSFHGHLRATAGSIEMQYGHVPADKPGTSIPAASAVSWKLPASDQSIPR